MTINNYHIQNAQDRMLYNEVCIAEKTKTSSHGAWPGYH
jgi:hypothetical protein